MAEAIRFEWDPRKAESNKRKHGMSFAFATNVFVDGFVEKEIQGHDYGEIRWTALGQVGGTLVHVTYTSREEGDVEIYRIISARKATRHERRTYQGYTKNDR